MTLQLRPTFSESWYRVKSLKVKLRVGAQISRQYYRGDRWYVVRDPAGNQFHRLSDAAYRFIGLLDGSRTVEEAWDLVGGTLEDDAPTQPEVIQILSHLYSANLIDADVTPDATVLLRRHKQLSKRKMQGRLMNVLFPRLPLWDPDRFLKRWMPLVRMMFSKFGAMVWLVVVISAIVALTPYWNDPQHSLKRAAVHAVDIRSNWINLIWLWAVFVFIKLIHELGHAFGCRRFGGECHELGIMFLVFVPTPYVDASTAWSFSNKWERVFVGAAGMIVELFFASLMAFIWIHTTDTSLINQLAFNAMLVASVTTIIFNANPLLRYDGYYILADFLEIPNLRQKSTDYAMGLIKRHLFGIKLQQPLPPVLQRFWLFTYAIASTIYRTFIGVVIILMVAYQIPVLGMLMALGGVVTWLLVPVFKVFKYLAIEPELHRKRTRATAICLAAAAAAAVLIGLVRFPFHVDEVGITEAAAHATIRPGGPGFVESIAAKDGQQLNAQDPILVCSSPELERDIAQTQAQLQEYQDRLNASRADDPAQARIEEDALGAVREHLAQLEHKKAELTIRAPINGVLIAPTLNEYGQRRFIQPGEEIAKVAQSDHLILRVLLEQTEAELITSKVNKTLVRFSGDLGTVVTASGKPRMMGGATRDLPSPALAQPGGEEEQVDPRDPTKSMTEQFVLEVPVNNPGQKYYPGQRAYVRFTLESRPLIWQWGRKFYQLIQMRNSPWM